MTPTQYPWLEQAANPGYVHVERCDSDEAALRWIRAAQRWVEARPAVSVETRRLGNVVLLRWSTR